MLEAMGVDVVEVDGVPRLRTFTKPSGKKEPQILVRCRKCDREFWLERWRLENARPGSCQRCARTRLQRWGNRQYPKAGGQ